MQSLTLPRRIGANGFGKAVNFAIPLAVAALAASAAGRSLSQPAHTE